MLTITECPRDAIQGLKKIIPTIAKAEYYKELCKMGFDVLDMGSFVSPKAVPQLSDTHEVLQKITQEDKNGTDFLLIVANAMGIDNAVKEPLVDFLGFPFSISKEFQLRNTKKTPKESLKLVEYLLQQSVQNRKKSRIYLSMAFGNPYQENWSTDLLLNWMDELIKLGADDFALSDTVGTASPKQIEEVFKACYRSFPKQNFSAHLHSHPNDAADKIKAAFNAGNTSFDVALNGMGGCPFASDNLTGNIDTLTLIDTLKEELSPNFKLQELTNIAQKANSFYSLGM